jgi:hypothetical protein
MQLLHTYDDREEAEEAAQKIIGNKRLASERDSTKIIYNLFGEASWGNFYRLNLFNLRELEQILNQKQSGQSYDSVRYKEILEMLSYTAKAFNMVIPDHWQ